MPGQPAAAKWYSVCKTRRCRVDPRSPLRRRALSCSTAKSRMKGGGGVQASRPSGLTVTSASTTISAAVVAGYFVSVLVVYGGGAVAVACVECGNIDNGG